MADDFGSHLRHQRELRGVSIDEIASITKIHTRYLKALEDNAFDELPGEVFIKGFIRSYGKAIGANIEELLSTYDGSVGHERQEEVKTSRSDAGVGESKKQVFWVNSFVGIFLGVFVLFAIWYLIQNPPTFDEKETTASSSSESKQASSSNSKKKKDSTTTASSPKKNEAPPKTETTSAKEPPSPGGTKKKSEKKLAQKKPEPKPKGKPDKPSGSAKKETNPPAKTREKPENKPTSTAKSKNFAVTASIDPPTKKPENKDVKEKTANAPEANEPPKALKLVIKVSENTWFNLSVDGAQERDFILPTGQTKAFSADKLFLLTIGNRRGTELKLNGKTLTLPKTRDNVIRDFAVTSNLIE